jgi:hypothetical protein
VVDKAVDYKPSIRVNTYLENRSGVKMLATPGELNNKLNQRSMVDKSAVSNRFSGLTSMCASSNN